MRQSCWSHAAPSSVLNVYYDKICLKFASHHFLLYVVYMCQKSLNFTYASKCYTRNNISCKGFTLARPPCRTTFHRLSSSEILMHSSSHLYRHIISNCYLTGKFFYTYNNSAVYMYRLDSLPKWHIMFTVRLMNNFYSP